MLVERAEAAAAEAVIPDGDGVLHSMRGYSAFVRGDPDGCAAEAPAFEALRASSSGSPPSGPRRR